MGLVVGLIACDSGGGTTDDSNNGPPNDGGSGVAQTFTVTVESTDDSYAYSDQNNNGVAYAIDAEVGQTVTLERGKTYEFVLEDGLSPSHPFYIGTTAEGGSGDEFRDDPAKATTGTVTFTVPTGAPDLLYYVCGNHVYMGGDIEITSASGGSGSPGTDY